MNEEKKTTKNNVACRIDQTANTNDTIKRHTEARHTTLNDATETYEYNTACTTLPRSSSVTPHHNANVIIATLSVSCFR